jgi:hypothetical protein
MWNLSFQQSILDSGEVLNMVSINSSKSVNANAYVSNIRSPLTLAINIDSSKLPLKEEITGPTGQVVHMKYFSEDFHYAFNPNITGKYVVDIFNLSAKPVKISMFFGHLLQLVDVNNTVIDYRMFQEIILGTFIIFIGIEFIVIGIILRVLEMRNEGLLPN